MYNWGYLPYSTSPAYRGYPENWGVNSQGMNQGTESDLLKELEGQINGLKSEQIAAYNQMVTEYLRSQLSYRIGEIQREMTPQEVLRHFIPQGNNE